MKVSESHEKCVHIFFKVECDCCSNLSQMEICENIFKNKDLKIADSSGLKEEAGKYIIRTKLDEGI